MTDSDSNTKPQETPLTGANNGNSSAETQKPNAGAIAQGQTENGMDKDTLAQTNTSAQTGEMKTGKQGKESKAGKDDGVPKDKKEKTKPEKTKPIKTAATADGKSPRLVPIIAFLALLVSIAIAAASYVNYTRWQISDVKSQSLTNENTKLRNQLDGLQQQVSGMQRQDLEFKLKEEQLGDDVKLQSDSIKRLSQQFQALNAEKGRGPLLWRIAEVEYLLSVANNRLQLERDVPTALVALQDADRRLEAIGDPALIPIRKSIAGEIIAVQSVDRPDVTGMALRLSSLVEGIEKLPLVSRERVKTEEPQGDSTLVSNFSQFWANLLKDLKGVVSIRRSGQPIEPLLPPDEQYYLSQNLALKLEEARIALLRRDTDTFRQDLTDTRNWVEQYFDKQSAAVSNVIATVDEMQTVTLKPDLPDISGSLRQLRQWMALQQQNIKSSAQLNPSTENRSREHESLENKFLENKSLEKKPSEDKG